MWKQGRHILTKSKVLFGVPVINMQLTHIYMEE
jgi:hypothetical protein